MGEEQGGAAKIILAVLGVLLLLVITPIILFLGAGEEHTAADPYAPCVIEGTPIGETDQDGTTVTIPEQYRDAVEQSAHTAGLPVGIIAAQIQQESGWNPTAISPVGARGIAQFMPATGVEWLTAAEKKATSQPTVKLMSEHHEQNTIAVTATWQWVTQDGESWAGDGKQTFFFTFTDSKPYKIRDYVSTVR